MKTEIQIYQDIKQFNLACDLHNVTPSTLTYEGSEVIGALVRDDQGTVIIILVCDQAAWDSAEFKNKY